MRILVIDDDESDAERLRAGLMQQGYAVDVALTGEDAEELAEAIRYNLLILEIILRGKNGFELCQSLRQKNVLTPILILTRLDATEDHLRGLDLGADDYMTKPFLFSVLFARVRALLRRGPSIVNPQLRAGDLVLDTISREIWYKAVLIKIFGIELSILELLMRQPNRIVSHKIIAELVWPFDLTPDSHVIAEHIKNLRAKLASEGPEVLIETVRGVGYRLNIHDLLKRTIPPVTVFLIGLFFTVQSHTHWLDLVVGAD